LLLLLLLVVVVVCVRYVDFLCVLVCAWIERPRQE